MLYESLIPAIHYCSFKSINYTCVVLEFFWPNATITIFLFKPFCIAIIAIEYISSKIFSFANACAQSKHGSDVVKPAKGMKNLETCDTCSFCRFQSQKS